MISQSVRRPPRLLIVTGKGGVGKSTVAAALALAAAQRGLQTIVAEVAGRRDAARMLGAAARAGETETAVGESLWHLTIDPHAAMEDYLRHEVPGRLPGAVLTRSRAFEALAMAAPGLRELVTIGKVWELAQRPRRRRGAAVYDLVILDAPATGHAIGLLAAARTFARVARIGPIARQAQKIDQALRDRFFTSVTAVAVPEQMAVSETLSLQLTLADELDIALGAVIVNRVLPARFTRAELQAIARLREDPAARSAHWFGSRARAQRRQLARLRRGLEGQPVRSLPFVLGAWNRQDDSQALAAVLARRLK
jgi:anion-transporting  ArsA/GET3 family ATPase